jgi:hypothetical protein
LKIPRVRGGKSSKNRRDLVEDIQNHLGRALEPQEMEWEWKREPRVLRGKRLPYITLKPEGRTCLGWRARYVRDRSWICLGQRLNMSGAN